jgi:hypothetical protein
VALAAATARTSEAIFCGLLLAIFCGLLLVAPAAPAALPSDPDCQSRERMENPEAESLEELPAGSYLAVSKK